MKRSRDAERRRKDRRQIYPPPPPPYQTAEGTVDEDRRREVDRRNTWVRDVVLETGEGEGSEAERD